MVHTLNNKNYSNFIKCLYIS